MFYFKFSFRVWMPLLNLPKHPAVLRKKKYRFFRYARSFDFAQDDIGKQIYNHVVIASVSVAISR